MKVLVVEDDPATARLLESALSKAGHLVCRRDSAEAAQAMLDAEGLSEWPFCIIDLALPGKDGLWLCDWIRRQPGGDHPYLLIGTGSDHTEKLSAAFAAGAGSQSISGKNSSEIWLGCWCHSGMRAV